MPILGISAGLKIFGIWSRVKKIGAWFLDRPLLLALVVVSTVAAWLLFITLPETRRDLEEVRETYANYRGKAEENAKHLAARNLQLQRNYDKATEEVQDYAEDLQQQAAISQRNYINANRLRKACGAFGQSPTSTETSASGDTLGASEVPDLDGIVVSEADFDIVTQNTVKALACHRWAVELEGMGEGER